MVLGG